MRVVYLFPCEMRGIRGKQGGVKFQEGLTEQLVEDRRDLIPVGLIPANPREISVRSRPGWDETNKALGICEIVTFYIY
jgi:hypothetical protein